MRTSKCSGELTLTLAKSTGSPSSAAVHDLDHADAVARGGLRRRLAGPHAVGQPDRRQRPQQVARVERDVVGLEHVAPRRVERVGHLRELQSCSRSAIVPSRRSPSIRTNGGPCTGQKIMWSPPIRGRGPGRAPASRTRAARGRPGRAETRGRSGPIVPVDRLAGLAEQVERARMVELHADLARRAAPTPSSSVASASSDSGSNRGPWFRITSAQCTGGPSWAFAARRDGRVPGRLGPDSCRWTETTFGVFRDGCVAVFCPPVRRTRSPPTVARVEWL